MSFYPPVWNSKLNSYIIEFKQKAYFSEIYQYSVEDTVFPLEPDIISKDFKVITDEIIDIIVKEGSVWFASPIQKAIVLKKLKHTFIKKEGSYLYGQYIVKWNTKSIEISSNQFTLLWVLESIIPYTDTTTSIEYSNDLESNSIDIIETTPIVEVIEPILPYNNKTEELQISSRALLKKRIRLNKLKIATLQIDLTSAKLHAEQLSKKYFRRYGSLRVEGSGSELSTDSESEDS
jgi:hypothetical protein